MQRVRLTTQRIRDAKCPEDLKSRNGKPLNQLFIWDTEVPRLALRVTTAGAKAFVFESKLDRRTIRLTIGNPMNWTVEDARKEARSLQAMVDQGDDPREIKKQKRAAREAAAKEAKKSKTITLKALLDQYEGDLRARGKKRYADGVKSATKCHLVEADPDLARTPARDITPEDVASLVRRLKEADKTRMAGMFRSYLQAAFNCAWKAPLSAEIPAAFIDFGVKVNPVAPVPAIPVNAREHTLSKDELKVYLIALDGGGRIDMALKLAVYAGGQRMAQLLRAKINDYDSDAKLLTLWDPKGKRTAPRKHVVPLGGTGTSIVSSLISLAEVEKTTLLFPSSVGTPIYINTPGKRVAEISREMGGEVFDLRDIRRTIETMMANLGISKDIRAQLLSHGISGVQAVHYDKHDYIKEKRKAIRKWETFLGRLVK